MIQTQIECILADLRITPKYKGYAPLLIILTGATAGDQPIKIKTLYCIAAKRLQCTSSAVERNIRTIIKIAMRNKTPLATALFGRAVTVSNKTFVKTIMEYLGDSG